MAPDRSNRHDWNDWGNYQHVHQQRLEQFLGHFILEERLVPEVTKTLVSWDGTLFCRDGIEIYIKKRQRVRIVRGRIQVRTVEYSYHALRRVGDRIEQILRYDNMHVRPSHPTPHHRHRFDAEGNESIEHVGEEGWPTLGDFLNEVYECWRARQEHLPLRDD